MLDTKQLGKRIALLRKQNGMSQEKLADLLCISPQAISKWENGHTTPETSLLPVLAQIFQCSIDEIIMPAYLFDLEIEEKKTNSWDLQAKKIADYIIRQLGGAMPEESIGLDDAIGGHTPDSSVLYFQRGNVTYCITGDECYLCDNMERNIPIGIRFCTEKNKMFTQKAHTEGWIPLPFHDAGILKKYDRLTENIVRIF